MRLAGFCLAMAAAAIAGASPIFRNPYPIPLVDPSASYLLAADFNRDGFKDLLVIAPRRSLAVYLNNGTGPFAAPVVTALPYYMGSPEIVDLNGDGNLDLVFSDVPTSSMISLLGGGDGTFAPGPSFGPVVMPGPVAAGDFNGDGFLDLAVVSIDPKSGDTGLSVWFGDGATHFSAGPPTRVNSGQVLKAVDFNLDGKMDAIVSGNYGTEVLIGDGHGNFARTSATYGGEVIVADFNHDGKPDLAVAAGASGAYVVAVSLGIGDGTLAPPVLYAAGYAAYSIDTADVDQDGNVDLLAAGTLGSTVAVLRGKGDGNFQPPELFTSGPGTYRIVTGDFDRDGKVDFITLDYNGYDMQALSFVRGNGDGSFKTYRGFHTNALLKRQWPGFSVSGAAAADMNSDGKPDVIVMQGHFGAQTCDLAVLLNDGTGKLSPPRLTDSELPGGIGRPPFAVGDVNNDRTPDVVALATGGFPETAKTFLGRGDGRFAPPISVSATQGKPILGHVNADTNLDLIVTQSNGAMVYPGNGDGTFAAGIQIPGMKVLFGDLNGDGKLDYLSWDFFAAKTCLNDGTGRFNCMSIPSLEGATPVTFADFDGDGKQDLFLTTASGFQTRFADAQGTLGASVDFFVELEPNPLTGLEPIVTADFDGDGKIDVVIGTTVYLSNGDGTFRSRAEYRTTNAAWTAAADMDGSGSADLVVTKTYADDIDVLLTRTTEDPTDSSSISFFKDIDFVGYGAPVTFTATVGRGAAAFGGDVVFSANGRDMAMIPVSRDGVAKFKTGFPIDNYEVTAAYRGDENYRPSSASMSLSVPKGDPGLSIVGFPNPLRFGASVTIRVDLKPHLAYGFAPPTGTITLRDGDTPLPKLVNGVLVFGPLSLGTHVISADYSGDAHFARTTKSYMQEIVPWPAITSISPSKGLINVEQRVTISGTNLGGTVEVTFGGRKATGLVVDGSTSVTVTTPRYPVPGPVDVVLTAVGGGTARVNGGFVFEIRPPRPHLGH